MARLFEHQGKAILGKAGIQVPRGQVATSPDEAISASDHLGLPVMVKVQSWTTGRAAAGGIAKAETRAEVGSHASRMLGMTFGKFPVTQVLIEERLSIARELFVSIGVDERARAPMMLLAASGGSGIEERAARTAKIPCHVRNGPDRAALRRAVESFGLGADIADRVMRTCERLFEIARTSDARTLEINPLAITTQGQIVAADCRMVIDDYAVSRHPEFGIEIARELDHPPTDLERIAYQIEQDDHRGTFFFAEMNSAATEGSKGLVGFHGAGGGGSMMSMDALNAEGFTPANLCDTSGNPSPAKVYRAARIILSQPGLVGYFGSGSGVANQEQFWSAYGLAKAFWELELDIPAVIRLGGNAEDRAVDILQGACRAAGLRGVVEGYRKTDTPAHIAGRFATLVNEHRKEHGAWRPRAIRVPRYVGSSSAACFDTRHGRVWIDLERWATSANAIIARSSGVLTDDRGRPAIVGGTDALLSKDSEMIACEVECRRDGVDGLFVELFMPRVAGVTSPREFDR